MSQDKSNPNLGSPNPELGLYVEHIPINAEDPTQSARRIRIYERITVATLGIGLGAEYYLLYVDQFPRDTVAQQLAVIATFLSPIAGSIFHFFFTTPEMYRYHVSYNKKTKDFG